MGLTFKSRYTVVHPPSQLFDFENMSFAGRYSVCFCVCLFVGKLIRFRVNWNTGQTSQTENQHHFGRKGHKKPVKEVVLERATVCSALGCKESLKSHSSQTNETVPIDWGADCCLGKVKPFQFNTQERAVNAAETESVRTEHPCETNGALLNAGMSLT